MRTPGIAIAVFLLSALAQAEVASGSEWVCGDATVTVTITQNSTANTTSNTFKDGAGTSPAAEGTPGENSSASAPTTEECAPTRTPGAEGEDYRVNDGTVEYKGDDGTWKKGKKKKKSTQQGGMYFFVASGSPVPHGGVLRAPGKPDYPMVKGEITPWAGVFGPEVVSLPG